MNSVLNTPGEDCHRVVSAKTPTEQTALKRQIAHTDNQIDQLTYQLYNLTEQEIKIIEDATQ